MPLMKCLAALQIVENFLELRPVGVLKELIDVVRRRVEDQAVAVGNEIPLKCSDVLGVPPTAKYG